MSSLSYSSSLCVVRKLWTRKYFSPFSFVVHFYFFRFSSLLTLPLNSHPARLCFVVFSWNYITSDVLESFWLLTIDDDVPLTVLLIHTLLRLLWNFRWILLAMRMILIFISCARMIRWWTSYIFFLFSHCEIPSEINDCRFGCRLLRMKISECRKVLALLFRV